MGNKNIIVLVGPQMSGKTMLCNALHDHFTGAIFDSDDWRATTEDIDDAKAFAAKQDAIIVTAQSVREAKKKLEQLELDIDNSIFFHLEATELSPVMYDQDQTAVMTVDYHLTKQAEPYTSIRAGVSLPVFVTPNDDLVAMADVYMGEIKTTVQAEIDAEFEAVGKPAPYSEERRGRVLVCGTDKLLPIIPEDIYEHTLPEPWPRIANYMDGHRLNYIRAHAPTEYPDYTIIDCTDGDLSKLPALEYVYLYSNTQLKLHVLATNENNFSTELQKQSGSWWNKTSRIGLPYSNQDWAFNATPDGHTLLDCRNGNFERVREVYAAIIIANDEPEPEEDDDEDTDGYEEDNE